MTSTARRTDSPLELRASLSVASLFALRMLGPFHPAVFAVHAQHLPGGDSRTLVGSALGAYGSRRGYWQIPTEWPPTARPSAVIVIGLLLFAPAASAAWAEHGGRDPGRSLQGAGAIAAR